MINYSLIVSFVVFFWCHHSTCQDTP